MTEQKKPASPNDETAGLAPFLAAEMQAAEWPSSALIAAVLQDALAARSTAAVAVRVARRWSWRLDVWQVLGGWRTVATLAACLLIGMTLGYTPSGGLGRLADTMLSTALSTAGLGDGSGAVTGAVTGADYFTLDDLQAEG